MDNNNPYAAPEAQLDDIRAWDQQNLEERKATRGRRLGAVLLDSLFALLCVVPMLIGAAMGSGVMRGNKPAGPMMAVMLLGVLALIALVVVNLVLVHRSGQTLGKRVLDIQIVRTSGERMGLLRYIFLRGLPVGLLGAIPVIGPLIQLLDPLLIFGNERRCLHDLIADTIVVNVE